MTVRECRYRGANTILRAIGAASLALALFAATALAGDPIRPDPRLTPGEVATTDVSMICQPGYSKSIRHTSGQLKAFIYREYHLDRRQGHYEIDHLIPLGIGGADVAANLWPQSYGTTPWNAAVKDQLEDHLHREVCAGRIPIDRAQQEIAQDWIAAYQKYFGSEPRATKQHQSP